MPQYPEEPFDDDDTFGAGDDDESRLRIYTTPGAQRSAFIEAMAAKQTARADEVGADTWREYADTYGPEILYAEIASINSRLKQLFWDMKYNLTKRERASDLLIDLGNYASFLYAEINDE